MTSSTPPPLRPPHLSPPVQTVEELHRHWCALMGPLGFGHRSIWMALFDGSGRPDEVLPRFDDVPDRPQPEHVRNLVTIATGVLAGMDADATAAFLLSRPGPAALTDDDLAWAESIRRQAATARTRVHPLIIATDEAVVIPPPARSAAA